MTLGVDVFWSFRSPWSYLATPRLAAWHEAYDLDDGRPRTAEEQPDVHRLTRLGALAEEMGAGLRPRS